jgi:hypothetical protein
MSKKENINQQDKNNDATNNAAGLVKIFYQILSIDKEDLKKIGQSVKSVLSKTEERISRIKFKDADKVDGFSIVQIAYNEDNGKLGERKIDCTYIYKSNCPDKFFEGLYKTFGYQLLDPSVAMQNEDLKDHANVTEGVLRGVPGIKIYSIRNPELKIFMSYTMTENLKDYIEKGSFPPEHQQIQKNERDLIQDKTTLNENVEKIKNALKKFDAFETEYAENLEDDGYIEIFEGELKLTKPQIKEVANLLAKNPKYNAIKEEAKQEEGSSLIDYDDQILSNNNFGQPKSEPEDNNNVAKLVEDFVKLYSSNDSVNKESVSYALQVIDDSPNCISGITKEVAEAELYKLLDKFLNADFDFNA